MSGCLYKEYITKEYMTMSRKALASTHLNLCNHPFSLKNDAKENSLEQKFSFW